MRNRILNLTDHCIIQLAPIIWSAPKKVSPDKHLGRWYSLFVESEMLSGM